MTDKIALVTGATSGIGKATAELLGSNRINLIITGRRNDRLTALAGELRNNFNIKVYEACFDITQRGEVKNFYDKLPEEWRKIDFLINNAGLASGLSQLHEGDIDDWEKMIDTNVKGLLYVTRLIAPLMVANKSGHIVNISSIAGKEVYNNGNVYCASKYAVDALNKAMRLELSAHQIKVTSINPGAVETEFSVVRFHGDENRAKAVYQGFDNLLASDIADAVWYAISRPKHVNINELIIMPTAQPVAGVIHRNS